MRQEVIPSSNDIQTLADIQDPNKWHVFEDLEMADRYKELVCRVRKDDDCVFVYVYWRDYLQRIYRIHDDWNPGDTPKPRKAALDTMHMAFTSDWWKSSDWVRFARDSGEVCDINGNAVEESQPVRYRLWAVVRWLLNWSSNWFRKGDAKKVDGEGEEVWPFRPLYWIKKPDNRPKKK